MFFYIYLFAIFNVYVNMTFPLVGPLTHLAKNPLQYLKDTYPKLRKK